MIDSFVTTSFICDELIVTVGFNLAFFSWLLTAPEVHENGTATIESGKQGGANKIISVPQPVANTT